MSELSNIISETDLNKTKKITLLKGDSLYSQGEVPKGLYFISKGHIALSTVSENGKQALLRVFGPGHFLGHRTLISKDTYHASAISLTKGELSFIPIALFESINDKSSSLLLHLAKILASELKIAENKFTALSTQNATARIIHALGYLKTIHPDYKVTRKEIGEFCGAKTETVSRVLTQIEKLGLVIKDGRDIKITNFDKLYKYAQKAEAIS